MTTIKLYSIYFLGLFLTFNFLLKPAFKDTFNPIQARTESINEITKKILN